ncbi:MAG: AEC family transporter [Oscillospiraceae bacterium]|jgi:predicted permease|nr:AEC family transporter [Oscillospiraceae bacterium]
MQFFSNMRTALEHVAMLYVMVGFGVIGERLHWFTAKNARRCTKLLFFIVTPCVILRSFFTMEYSPESLRGLAVSVGAGILLHAAGILLSEGFFRNPKKREAESVLHFASIYGNCGYMALPLAQALVGGAGVFYCSAVILTFQMFSFTHGVYVMRGGIPFQRKRGEARAPGAKFEWKHLILNAGVLSVLVGLPLFLFNLHLPRLLTVPMESVAAMNTPLAMLIFGAYLSRTSFKGILRSKKLPVAIGIKLFAIPAVVMAALLLFGAEGALLKALLISASAPSANNTVVMAAQQGRDAGYAAQVVGIISLLSIVTMPLMIALAMG